MLPLFQGERVLTSGNFVPVLPRPDVGYEFFAAPPLRHPLLFRNPVFLLTPEAGCCLATLIRRHLKRLIVLPRAPRYPLLHL